MYLDGTIKIPDSNGKITKKTIKGTTYIYEDDRKNSIRAYKVSGTTVRRKLYADDEKDIYYSDSKRQSEAI